MELFLKTFTNNNADTYKSYIRRTCTPKPWPPFGHLFEELFSIGARIRYVKNINAYNNKQLLISRGAWGVPVPGTKKTSLVFFLFPFLFCVCWKCENIPNFLPLIPVF